MNIGDSPDRFLDRLKNHPSYKLQLGDVRMLIGWDEANEGIYAIDALERKKAYRELDTY